VECGTHDVMIVAGKNGNTGTRLPVPYTNCLVVGSGKDPRVLMMKSYCSDVVEMPQEGEKTSSQFVVPNFNFVVVPTRYK